MCDIIYEDNQVLVAVKPQNLPVQQDDSKDEDFLRKIKKYLVEKYNKKGDAFVGLVHRLDRPTGGVMVFAKTSKSADRLCAQIKDKSFEKSYLAIVQGTPRLRQCRLTNFLKKDEKNNIVHICTQYEDGAKEAILDYQVLESCDDISLVKVDLVTGRSHQIRVQLAGIGCPVYNDQKYGDKKQKGNLALWAYSVKFNHPVSHERMTFKVIPPADETPWNKFVIEKYI
jgi:23S rRNA pseudouridine1911/1915/1917 synthase